MNYTQIILDKSERPKIQTYIQYVVSHILGRSVQPQCQSFKEKADYEQYILKR